jgi:hypothetical protein
MPGEPRKDESKDGQNSLPGQAAAALRFTANLPLRAAARLLRHAVQILFALFVVVLHPQVKWLSRRVARSFLVQTYVKPSLRVFTVYVYEPYFAYLSLLPPLWATISIALPLAVLEPAKLIATILVAERPKTGILLWLALQGLSLVLIDRTWTAVRPQSRKIRLVARIHAWIWLNAEYGKYWVKTSTAYRTAMRLKEQVRQVARAIRLRLVPPRRGRSI